MSGARPSGNLVVLIDGEAISDADGRAFWQRFSAWMEEHPGDLGGFARSEGYASVRPVHSGGKAVLMVSRSAAQVPYASTPKRN